MLCKKVDADNEADMLLLSRNNSIFIAFLLITIVPDLHWCTYGLTRPGLYDVVNVVLLLPSVVLIIMIQQADCY